MNKEIPDHGTSARYKGRKDLPGCRCRRCKTAANRADAQRTLDRMAGRPRTVDASRVRAHLLRLVAAEMSHDQIAASAGVSQTTVSHLVSGARRTVYAANEAKLLGVRLDDRTASCMTSSVGATRRLRGLYVLGHGPTKLAAELDVHRDTITQLAAGSWERITLGRHMAICEVYDRLAMVHGASDDARRWAKRQGWVPPLAWDDDMIDDPNAVPQIDAFEPPPTLGHNVVSRFLMGESVVLDRAGQLEAIRYLMEWSDKDTEEIGAPLGMSGDAVSKAWFRMKKKVRDAGGREPWRRVYIPKNELNRNDMESAA